MSVRRAPKPAQRLRREAQEHLRSAYQEAILDAARRVFERVGLYEARMADIAHEVGVSVGTLYNYFESKEQVVDALAQREREQFALVLAEARAQGEPLDRVRVTVHATLVFVEQRGALFATYTRLGMANEMDLKRVGGRECFDGYVRLLAVLEEDLELACQAGQIRADIPPRLLAAAVGGLLNAMMFTWLQDGRRESLVAREPLLLDLFMKGAARS
jgi:AcrR family transcriptional regulator